MRFRLNVNYPWSLAARQFEISHRLELLDTGNAGALARRVWARLTVEENPFAPCAHAGEGARVPRTKWPLKLKLNATLATFDVTTAEFFPETCRFAVRIKVPGARTSSSTGDLS
jgi:hypothetical protein